MPHYHQIKDFYPHLKNPEKYKGSRPITLRSGWEITFVKKIDKVCSILNENNQSLIIYWNSESVIIPYFNPIKNRMARYFMDFLIVYRTKDKGTKEVLIEIKPHKQTIPPKTQKRKTRRYINECSTYLVNQAKWKATEKFCENLRKQGRNIWFQIVTEKELFKNGKPL